MTWLDWEKEDEVVNDLKAGLEAAVDETGASLEPSEFDENDIDGWEEDIIKTQKLVYRAINKFDLPILHTWYRYGQFEPHDAFRQQSIQPKSLRHSTVNPDQPSVPNRNYPSPQDFKGFFIEVGIDEIAEQDFYDFLHENYSEFAPPEYRRLYIANLEILRILDQVFEDDEPAQNSEKYYQDFRKASTLICSEISAEPSFSLEVENHMKTSLQYFRDMFIKIAASKQLSEDQLDIINQSRELYHEQVWRWPALVISTNEAEGVDKVKFRQSGEEMLDDLRPEFKKELGDFRDEMFEKDMIPSSHEYKSVKSETPKALSNLEEASLEIYQWVVVRKKSS